MNLKCILGCKIESKKCVRCGQIFGLPKIKPNQFPMPPKKNVPLK